MLKKDAAKKEPEADQGDPVQELRYQVIKAAAYIDDIVSLCFSASRPPL